MSWLPSTGGGGTDPQTAVNTADIATIEGEQTTQDGLIAANTAKTGITSGQASEITANTAKVSYTDAAVVAGNSSDIASIQSDQSTQDSAIALNTAKTGITAGQASEITANTAKVSYDDTEAAAATAAITTLQGEQTTQDSAIALNTAKTGITAGQASEISANTAKVTNATHTGDVTGTTVLTLDATAITGQTLVTADALDHVVIADASDGALKKALVSDLGADNFVQQTGAPTGDSGLLWYDTDAVPTPQNVEPTTTETGTTHTLALANGWSTVIYSNAAAVTVTVPTNASVAFPVETTMLLVAAGAGGVSLITTGLTLIGSSPLVGCAQNEGLWLRKVDTDSWVVLGGTV